MNTIDTTPILDLGSGFAIHLTRAAGHVTDGVDRQGSPRRLSFAEGSPVLVDVDGKPVCGPIDYHGVKAFAGDVCRGHARAATEPGAAIRLATALLALMNTLEFAGCADLVMPAAEASHG